MDTRPDEEVEPTKPEPTESEILVPVDSAPSEGESQGEGPDDEEYEDYEDLGPLYRRPWFIVVMVVAVIALFPLVFSAFPQICAKCGALAPLYQSYQTDRHRASANCLDCHLEPGIRGVAIYPFSWYGDVLSVVTGGAIKPPKAVHPADSACRRSGCHSLNRIESLSGQIRVNHRMHSDEDVECYKCHPGAGHDGAEGRFMIPPMSLCKECHAKEMDNCRYCHIGKNLPTKSPDQ